MPPLGSRQAHFDSDRSTSVSSANPKLAINGVMGSFGGLVMGSRLVSTDQRREKDFPTTGPTGYQLEFPSLTASAG
jgi:hypothetical protein